MKYLITLIALLGFLSCAEKDDTIPEPEKSNPELNYNLDSGEIFSTVEPIMHYDLNQETTFIKFTDEHYKVRVNFRGNTTGIYTGLNGIFYKYSYDEDGSQSIDIVCDSNSGIEVTVTEYGEIGEMIKGSFTADNCDGLAEATSATGNFSVVRTE